MSTAFNFTLFFPSFENIHKYKDVGMIPYFLSKMKDMKVRIIYVDNNAVNIEPIDGIDFIALKPRILSKIINFLVKRSNSQLSSAIRSLTVIFENLIRYLRTLKSSDVFQQYHFNLRSILNSLFFKIINSKGISYIKMDLDPSFLKAGSISEIKNEIHLDRWKKGIKFGRVDLLSVENWEVYDSLRILFDDFDFFKSHFIYLPNGINVEELKRFVIPYDEKENYILHSGRLGTHQKATEIVIESFKKALTDIPGWKLILVGKMSESFNETFKRSIKGFEDRILYRGFVKRREDVLEIYSKSKILLMPSRFEGFPLLPLETSFLQVFFIGSDIGAHREITDNGTYGALCPIDDINCFSSKLVEIISNPERMKEMSVSHSRYILNKYNWETLCIELYHKLKELKEARF